MKSYRKITVQVPNGLCQLLDGMIACDFQYLLITILLIL